MENMENKEQFNKPKRSRKPRKPANRNGDATRHKGNYNVPFHAMDSILQPFVEKNQKMHQKRLTPFIKDSQNAKIKITPLGGLGEVGGNITVFETEKEAIIVDIGMSFPSEEMHGVDILIPDFTYLRQIRNKLVAFIITHGHEDHIGAVPYLFKEMQLPLYGTPLPLAMILNKFEEHKMTDNKKYFRPVEKRQILEIGNDFKVEWIHMTHSIIDSSSLAITTKAGTIIHTGDFKFDHTPIDGYPADIHRLSYYGEKGVLCLMSDSTNSHNNGVTKSEAVVGPTFDNIFAKAKGRIFMSTFSSNIHRVYQAIQSAEKFGRKVCVIGRSMERNIETAITYDYIRVSRDIFIDAFEINKYRDNEVMIITTGSQGETNSALYRMAQNEHRQVEIKQTDSIVISARAIPGNEKSISTIINYLEKLGANVFNKEDNIHVSGHAAQEEQKLMLRLTKPRFFLPVHGEFNHINAHRETAIKCGIDDRNILLMGDGEQIEITAKYMRKVRTVKTGKVFIDNQNNIKIDNGIVFDRQKLANDGVVVIVAEISKTEVELINRPIVTSYGLVADRQEKYLVQEISGVLSNFLMNIKPHLLEDPRGVEQDIKQVVRKHLYRKYKKYPLIVPTVFIM